MKWSYVHCVVFIAGSAVLAIEIGGTRILGPFYGVSLFLWSALITTTLMVSLEVRPGPAPDGCIKLPHCHNLLLNKCIKISGRHQKS